MMSEFVCYRCQCEVCGHEWKTRKLEMPKTCANQKCRSTKWNGGQEYVVDSQPIVARGVPLDDSLTVGRIEPVQEHRFTDVAMNPALDQFLAKHACQAPIAETVEIEWKWSQRNKPYKEEMSGDWVREQYYLNASSKPVYRTVVVDEDDLDCIKRVK
jgi:hypothetical protein